jgi:hypothetical protein
MVRGVDGEAMGGWDENGEVVGKRVIWFYPTRLV